MNDIASAQPSRTPIEFAELPTGTKARPVSFRSEDGAACRGILYTKNGERTAICISHPRGDLSRHYMIPYFLEAGYAVCGFTHREANDVALLHEIMLLDIAACIRMLQQDHGYERVVLFGNSIGGSVFGLYQWQAQLPPPCRFSETPSGDPPDLNTFDLPPADGLILLATSFGEAAVVARGLDPSIVQEADPRSRDAALDMFDPRNGYREPPQSSSYSAKFIERYYTAQTLRLQRLEAKARAMIEEQRRCGELTHGPQFARAFVERAQSDQDLDAAVMTVHGTHASLAFCDLSIFPSKRTVGTSASDAMKINTGAHALGRRKTAQAWISVSCERTSRSDLRRALPQVTVPTVIVNFTADRTTYPQDAECLLALCASSDKCLYHVDGEHFGRPVKGLNDPAPRETVGRLLSGWLRARFPDARAPDGQ